MPPSKKTPAFAVSLRGENGHIASYVFKRHDQHSETFYWSRSDGRGPAGGSFNIDPTLPVSLIAAKVLSAAGELLRNPYAPSDDE